MRDLIPNLAQAMIETITLRSHGLRARRRERNNLNRILAGHARKLLALDNHEPKET